MFSLRMLFRSWRGGELSLILWALVLAVAVVTSVSLLAERIERALTQESSSFLAADLVVRSSKEADPEWLDEANKREIHTARLMSFASIVFYGDDLHLASIKAVEPSYPLRGSIKRSLIPFSRDPNVIESVNFGPAEGEVWVDARLLPLLNVNLGDSIDLGDQSLKISHILVEEPDGSSYSFIGARVLMNYADVAATGVVQPGSRITYRYLMAANRASDMADYRTWLESQLDIHDRLITPDQAQESIADTMGEGRRFLLLAGSIGVVLAGIALANLWRRRNQSLIQMVGFSGAIALLMIMVVVRTSLIDQWRFQLAEDAPNHFLVNVAPYELDGVRDMVIDNNLETAGWYAMVRGRMVEINGQPITETQKDSHESFRRELNLSWTTDLPEGNKVEQGVWWDQLDLTKFESTAKTGNSLAPVSLEEQLAGELGLSLGDRMTFSVGGLTFEAEMVGTRTLNWDNMTPNFYFLFPEGLLEEYPRTSMTSLYIPPEKKLLVNDILRSYPTVQVIELDKIIDRIRTIVSQVTRGLEVMTLLILACGVLVMFAAVSLSMSERLQESAILRTLGSSKRLILGIQAIEFGGLGLMAGLLASAGAELSVAVLQRFIFDLPVTLHLWLWLVGPVGGLILVGFLGVVYSRKAVVQPPLEVLRSL